MAERSAAGELGAERSCAIGESLTRPAWPPLSRGRATRRSGQLWWGSFQATGYLARLRRLSQRPSLFAVLPHPEREVLPSTCPIQPGSCTADRSSVSPSNIPKSLAGLRYGRVHVLIRRGERTMLRAWYLSYSCVQIIKGFLRELCTVMVPWERPASPT
jgi:hypothetical protein